MSDYESFIAAKAHATTFDGITVKRVAGHLFPHQRDLVKWALRRGRAAIFADAGLGKTAMMLEWARHVCKRGRVLILAPLAVAEQTVREGQKFGVDVVCLRDDDGASPLVVTNYEMLHHFNPADFVGVVLDESSIIKDHSGATRNALIVAFAATPFRLCCTATPAPNDFTELGSHAEFLGIKSRVEMLAEFFTHDSGDTQDWAIKGHAVDAFWAWVCTWGAMVKRPSDLGHDDGAFALPPLRMHERIVPVEHKDAWAAGYLFAPDAKSLNEQRATRRITMAKRLAIAADLVSNDEPAIVWCELNAEADAIEKAVPGAVQVAGSDTIDDKRERLLGFADGKHRVMVTKASLAGHGLNWQHCRRMVFVGASHSFESTYQAIRRCWRFGQTQPVDVFVIRAETEGAIVENFRRKEADAETLAAEMGARMRATMRAEILGAKREYAHYEPRKVLAFPEWLKEGAA